jgi:hypothetical protein
MISVSASISAGMVEMVAWLGAYSDPTDLRLLRPYIAIGTGDNEWDVNVPDSPTGSEIKLESEIARRVPYLYHPLDATEFDRGKLLYTGSPADILRFVGEFEGKSSFHSRVPGAYVREMGLFIHASETSNSGQLAVLVRHGKIWWDSFWNWRREIIVDMRSK